MDLTQLLAQSTQGIDPNDAWLGGDNMPSFDDNYEVQGQAPQVPTIDPGVQKYLQQVVASNNPQMIPPGMQTQLQPGDMLQNIMGGGGQSGSGLGSIFSGVGSGLDAASQYQRTNRLIKGNFTQDYDKLMMEAQKARDEDEGNSLKRLAQTGYLQGKSGMTLDPGKFSPYASGMMPKVSDAQKQGAANLEGQLIKRLAPGGTYTPQPLDSYATPSTAENVTGYGGMLGDVLGGLSKGGGFTQQGSPGVNWSNVISDIGKIGKPIVSGIETAGKWLGGLF